MLCLYLLYCVLVFFTEKKHWLSWQLSVPQQRQDLLLGAHQDALSVIVSYGCM